MYMKGKEKEESVQKHDFITYMLLKKILFKEIFDSKRHIIIQ